jgi:hypothetical protein
LSPLRVQELPIALLEREPLAQADGLFALIERAWSAADSSRKVAVSFLWRFLIMAPSVF